MSNLYHYTSVKGFEGIISANSVRMTKSEFLNDPLDCHLFIELVKKYLQNHPDDIRKAISNLKSNKDEVRELYDNKGCDLVSYIEYIKKNIGLYVMSLSHECDALNMWNYYGQGGMQLDFSIEELTHSFRSTFVSENEYLTEAEVIYANVECDIEDISVPNFSEFVLMNKRSPNILADHCEFIQKNSNYPAAQLYSISNLGEFIRIYLKGFISSIEYLFRNEEITIDTDKSLVFERVFVNTLELNDFYYWKHDLSLYMIMLAALIKSDTYEYEKEHRIVYFENTIDHKKQKTEEYTSKSIDSKRFVYPYITFEKECLLNDSLKRVVLSPVTNNIPIDNEIYVETLKKYLKSKGFGGDVQVECSKHKIRW